MAIDSGVARRSVFAVAESEFSDHSDALIAEAPVELRINGSAYAVIMATPTALEDLIHGFLVTEGLAGRIDDIASVDVTESLEGYTAEITCDGSSELEARLLPSRSGCGLCGARTLEDAVRQWPPAPDAEPFNSEAVTNALAALPSHQALNAQTGAAHAAAWISRSGELLLIREDVGRHNALDKLLGALLKSSTDFSSGFVVVTSRASYEMVSKVLSCGIGLLVAISAPTALAVDVAMSGNLCLLAFARDRRFNVYSHAKRIALDAL